MLLMPRRVAASATPCARLPAEQAMTPLALTTGESWQILGFQVELAVLGQLGGLDEVGLAGNVLEHKGSVVDFIQSQHDDSFPFSFP